MKRFVFCVSLMVAALVSLPGSASARVSGDIFASSQAIPDQALDKLRGGLRIGGFSFNFGLTVRSTIEGTMEMVTRLISNVPGHWQHVATESWIAPQNGNSSTEISNSKNSTNTTTNNNSNINTTNTKNNNNINSNNTNNNINTHNPNNNTNNVPPPTQLAGTNDVPTKDSINPPAPNSTEPPTGPGKPFTVDQGDGVEVAIGDPNGSQIVHNITQSHIATLISNQLDGKEITSVAELDITIANFQQVMSKIAPAIYARRLTRGLGLLNLQ